ncbi:MAG: hypothetical protein M1829_006483, partial [Trizodia sp. TS-e1964]
MSSIISDSSLSQPGSSSLPGSLLPHAPHSDLHPAPVIADTRPAVLAFSQIIEDKFLIYIEITSKNRQNFSASKRARYRMILSKPDEAKPGNFKMLDKRTRTKISNKLHDAKSNYSLNSDNQLVRKSVGPEANNEPEPERIVAFHYDAFKHILNAHEA